MPKRKISSINADNKSEYVYTWKIKNYSFCSKSKGESISSPLFNVENLCVGQWRLMLYPRGIAKLKDDDFLSCCLAWAPPYSFQNPISKTPEISYGLEIAREGGGVLKYRENKSRVFTKKAKVWGVMRFIKIDDLEAEMKKWKEDALVIRCRIKFDTRKKQKISGLEACTTVDVERRFFEWDVKIPMSLQYSETIIFPFSELYSFEITLMENFSIFFEMDYAPELVKIRIAVHDEKDNEVTSKCAVQSFKRKEMWKFPDILTRKVLEICKVDSYNCNFTLKCEICIPRGLGNSSTEKVNYKTSACAMFLPLDTSIPRYQTDFENLYNDKSLCDLTIRAGDDEFSVHKLVLSMRSPVFKAMLEQDMLEKGTGVVNVADIDGETMKIFLEYVYSGKVEKMGWESAKKLILAADKYQVSCLVDRCVSFLKADLSVEGVLDIFSVAESLNQECLKTCAFYFIKANIGKVLITPYWTEWMKKNINLASDILCNLFVDLDAICK